MPSGGQSQSDVLTLGLFFPFSVPGSNVALGDLVNNTVSSAGFAVSSVYRICGEIELTFVEKQKQETFTSQKPMSACLLEHS